MVNVSGQHPADPHDPHGRRRRRRRDQGDDGGDLGCLSDAAGSCKSCGRPLRGCDGCDLFHLSVLLGFFALGTPTRAARATPSVPARVGLAAIRGYQRWLSHRLRTCCRHAPTCSHYGLGAVERYGLLHGARLTAGRISRCTDDVPRGTTDPVP